jgi:hypothetical protein
MTLLEAYVLFGIPVIVLSMGVAAVLWARWEEDAERRRRLPGE